ncbi:unnamed protein product [Meloidogyne enterolobii]|uniref:Uncharacterized protein n=2 Tax=Meloidogyne enterolobii TaxID=390850 RepID=A0A6V7YDL0_MELEN|nr:unnamed protein product [Meloidogyne enterolobii]
MGNHKRLRDESISSDIEVDKTPILTQTQLEQITQNVVQLLTPIIETTIKTLFEQLHQKYNNNQLPSQTQQSTSRWGCPPNLMPPKIKQAAMTIEHLQQPVFDENLKELYKKKSFYAVIERFPELENEEEDLKNIERNVQIVINNKNFKEAKNFEVKRHGIKKQNNYHRIIKVKFSTPAAAHSFINQYRTIHKPTLGGHSPFARRDLTPPELQLQNYLKQQVKEINAKHGNGTACYRNLKIYYKKQVNLD